MSDERETEAPIVKPRRYRMVAVVDAITARDAVRAIADYVLEAKASGEDAQQAALRKIAAHLERLRDMKVGTNFRSTTVDLVVTFDAIDAPPR